MMALAFLPAWGSLVRIGSQLRQRQEPGYRRHLWGWKQEHPAAYHVATNSGGLLGGAACIALEWVAGWPHLTPWLFLLLAPVVVLGWILNAPKRHQPPAAPVA
jgi:hypothetical protein